MYKLKLQQTTHTKAQESNCVTHNKNISQSGESNMINKSIKKMAVNQKVQSSCKTALIKEFEVFTDKQCPKVWLIILSIIVTNLNHLSQQPLLKTCVPGHIGHHFIAKECVLNKVQK